MLKYAALFLFAINAFADVPCCPEKERSTSYLDIAVDLISKAKDSIPDCQGKTECPKIKECNITEICRDVKDCNGTEVCPEIEESDCADWYLKGYNKSGIYTIRQMYPSTSKKSRDVFCDMDTEGGGWTVIQRRANFYRPNDYFYKDWKSYKDGFGDIQRDFWLGNDNIFALTNQKPNSIRFDLEDKDRNRAYAIYSEFWIDSELNKYMLHISNYRGNAGDSMKYHNNKKFTTQDQQNDNYKENCAVKRKGAWWFDGCYEAHLNGLYNATSQGIIWSTWRDYATPSLIWTEMKIRPSNFTGKALR